ncbi:MAG: hypothetical protein ACKO96_09890, partial [Flammeovirgaceae bacterium]
PKTPDENEVYEFLIKFSLPTSIKMFTSAIRSVRSAFFTQLAVFEVSFTYSEITIAIDVDEVARGKITIFKVSDEDTLLIDVDASAVWSFSHF